MTTARLLPPPYSQFYDNSGKPLSGGKVYFYLADTTTLSAVYSNYDGTRISNPVKLDDKGRARIYLDDTTRHDMVVRDMYGTLQYEQPDIIPARGIDLSSTHESSVGSGGSSVIPDGAIVTSITGTSPIFSPTYLYFFASWPTYNPITVDKIKLSTDATSQSQYLFPNDNLYIKDNNENMLFKVIYPDTSSGEYGAMWGVEHQNGLGTAPYLQFPYTNYTYGAGRKVRYLAKGTGHVYLNGYRFPNSNGSSGQKLQTDGSKVLSWA